MLDDNDKKKEDKKTKKKKNKRDGRKDKKKRNRVKKRKRGSSSSSSGSDDSDSSSGSEDTNKKNESETDTKKHSIRVQMRNNLAKEKPTKNDEKSGKWTMVSLHDAPVPPPAPSFSESSIQEKKKDEQIMTQWNTVEPIISQEEKRLLESLKGRLKSQQAEAPSKSATNSGRKVEEKEKPREKEERVRERERSREKSRDRSRGRSNDRLRGSRNYRGRRSRSRSRSRSRGRYSRRYSRSRSGSRGRRRVERPIVTFPEPRLPPTREDKKLPARSYVMSKKEDLSNTKKVMPMIGKMPVFKKQQSDKKSEESAEEKKDDETPVEESAAVKAPRDDSWDDFMPDPLQYSALMGPPPAPPIIEPEPEVIPPGLDPEQDSEFIPKPISDAPIARKGPLPKDFQDTLDLLYDDDGQVKPVIIEPKHVPEALPIEPPPIIPDPDGPQMIKAEDLSNHAMLYGGYYDGSEETDLKMPEDKPEETAIESKESINGNPEMETDEKSKEQQMEMDDLAMLGIDVNDVGSGLW